MKKKIFWSIAILLIGFRLYLPTLMKNYANKQLSKDPIYQGHIEDIGVHLWRGAYTANDFKIVEVQGQKIFPFISAKKIDVGLSWRDLFHRRIVAKMGISDLVLNIVQEPKPEGKKIVLGQDTKAGKKAELQGWQVVFKNLVPLEVNLLNVQGGSIHFRDLTSSPQLDIYLDRLSIKGTNLTNSLKVSESLFGTVDIKARAMGSGDLNIKLLINPLVSPPEFKATTTLKNLDLTQLNKLFTAYAKFDVARGDFYLYSEVATANNNLKGYVKPLIQNLKVTDFKEDKKKGLGHAFWEEIVGAIAGILKNFPKKRQAAVINFDGKLDDPKINGWDIAKSILHNMFIKPIAPKIDHSVKLKDVKN